MWRTIILAALKGKTATIKMLITLLSGAISQEVIGVLAVLNALRADLRPKVIFDL
jgi:hypothetical protein